MRRLRSAGKAWAQLEREIGSSSYARPLLLLVITVLSSAAIGMAFLAGSAYGAPEPSTTDTFTILLLLVFAGSLGIEFRARSEGDRLDLFDATLAIALVTLAGPMLLVLVAVAKALGLAVRRVAPVKIAFNVAQWGCAAASGALVFAMLRTHGPVAPADLGMLVVALLVVATVNTIAVLVVLSVVGDRSAFKASSRGLVLGSAVNTPVNLAMGLAFAAVWTLAPGARLAIPAALVAVHLATRIWAQQQAGRSRLAGLNRAGAALNRTGDITAAIPQFLAEVRYAFECSGVELHLPLGPDGRWTRAVCGEDGNHQHSAPLVGELLRRGSAVRLAPGDGASDLLALLDGAGWRDCLAAPVRFDGLVVGLLCTHDREGWEGFEAAELGVLEAAAGVLGEALQRDRLAEVLRFEQAALRASEDRWQVFARILQLISGGTPLPETLDLLARTLEERTAGARCAVLVRVPGRPLALAAPSFDGPVSAALQTMLLESAPTPSSDTRNVSLVDLRPTEQLTPDLSHQVLLADGVQTMRTWPIPFAPGSNAQGVLALCYPDDWRRHDHTRAAGDAVRVGGLAVDHSLAQQRLAHQAAHDPLTDLPNRAVFLDRLSRALRGAGRGPTWVLVIFLDLDRFKVVNDSLGHRAGDALLCAVADRLRRSVRPGDTVARFGGDEFTMLCEGITDEEHAFRVVHRVQETLKQPFPLGDSELFATSSIGIALGRGSAASPETLLEDADAAMYRAKESGGNCYELFDAAMRDRAVRRLTTQSALHRAIEREEFRVVYQPTVRLPAGTVEGVEALVRWDRPQHGVVQPGDFVPLAEETGLIVPIGAYVLEQACQQARRWQDALPAGTAPSISVNLSARQLTDPGLVDLVGGAIERSGMEPSTLALEITETVLMGDVSASGLVLTRLKQLGVRLLVDDFGTGYSSLTYLQRFPVDGLKVDRSFVAGLGAPGDAGAIVGAVIGLAHGLGLTVTAEGVETLGQLQHLVDLDCDVAQGFHFGHPVPAEQVVLAPAS